MTDDATTIAPLTADERAAITPLTSREWANVLAQHYLTTEDTGVPYCNGCEDEDWPCVIVRMKASLDAERAARECAEVERDRLRFALRNGGLAVMAECPSCGAERTNGERHDEDCPILSFPTSANPPD